MKEQRRDKERGTGRNELMNMLLLNCAALAAYSSSARGGGPGPIGALGPQTICRVEMHQRRETQSAADGGWSVEMWSDSLEEGRVVEYKA